MAQQLELWHKPGSWVVLQLINSNLGQTAAEGSHAGTLPMVAQGVRLLWTLLELWKHEARGNRCRHMYFNRIRWRP